MPKLSQTLERLILLLRSRKNLADAALTLVVRILAAVLAYGVQVFLARTLALDEYGVYVTMWTWLIIANHLAVFGFSDSSLRFLPRYSERKQYNWAVGFLKTGYLFSTIGAAALGICGFLFLWVYGDALPPQYLMPSMVLALGLPIMALELYLEGVSRAFGWYMLTVVPAYVMRPLLIALGVLIAYLLGYTPDATMVLALAVAITSAIVVAQSLIIRSRIKKTVW